MPEPRGRETSAMPSRDLESRENTTRAKLWQPASLLPDPDPQEGWTFRWIRTDTLGESDALNVDRQRREGWVPVKASDHSEIQLGASPDGNIRSGGLMLCKRPLETTVSHRQYLQEQTARQVQSADHELVRDTDSRTNMRFEQPRRESDVTTGRRNLTFRQ